MRINTRLSIARCESSAYMYYGFNEYHYLQGINKSARCFLFYLNGEVAGFCSFVNQTFRGCSNGVRFHRIAVLPQFLHQGLGSMMCDFMAAIFQNNGYRVYIKCQSDALGTHLGNHPENWSATGNHRKIKKDKGSEGKKFKNRMETACYCYKFVGNSIKGHEDLLLPIAEMRASNRLFIQKKISETGIIEKPVHIDKQVKTGIKTVQQPTLYFIIPLLLSSKAIYSKEQINRRTAPKAKQASHHRYTGNIFSG